ncbi:hypothetical protein CDAR_247141 [Caerostris darwini]|uniref:Uncharacterized protein n=1 Tax=Caerostris darwini TaxID=1538125 RepID=A0AAV4TUQ6_9ARAC|nr:hypothetical protein CDAR_247141 [Caerostris darwini]
MSDKDSKISQAEKDDKKSSSKKDDKSSSKKDDKKSSSKKDDKSSSKKDDKKSSSKKDDKKSCSKKDDQKAEADESSEIISEDVSLKKDKPRNVSENSSKEDAKMTVGVINCEFCGTVSPDEQHMSQHIVDEHQKDVVTRACSESSSLITHSSDDLLKGTDSHPVCDACDIVKDLSSSISLCPTHEKEEELREAERKEQKKVEESHMYT